LKPNQQKWGCGLSGAMQQAAATGLAMFDVKNPAILNIPWDNPGNLTKRWHILA